MKKILTALLTIAGTVYGAYEFYDLFAGDDYGSKLQFGPIELYFTDDVNEAKVTQLGNYLDSTDFTGGDAMSMQLDMVDESYQFKLAVKDGVANNEEYAPLFRNVLNDLKSNIFPTTDLSLSLTDDKFEIQQTIIYDETLAKPYGEMLLFNGTEVYYKDASIEQATALGNYLVSSEFADGSEKAVQLTKNDKALVFKMIVDESLLNDAEYERLFTEFKGKINEGAFKGQGLQLHLTDEFFNTKKVFE